MTKYNEDNLIELLDAVSAKVETAANWDLKEQLAQLRTTYETFLRYMVSGVEDPAAPDILHRLVVSAYTVNDRADRLLRLRNRPGDRYSAYVATTAAAEHSVSEFHERLLCLADLKTGLAAQRDALLCEMFQTVWTSDQWSKSDYTAAFELVTDDSLSDADRAVFVSAVTLSLFDYFDRRKLMLIFDAYLTDSCEVQQRAVVGLVLSLRKYDDRISLFDDAVSRLRLYADDPNFVRDFYATLVQLQYTRYTDAINSRLSTDIMPALIKSHSKGKDLSDLKRQFVDMGENPEWHDALNPEAEEKMRELSELYHEGADVHYTTFFHFKNYDFFHQMPRWFYPFTPQLMGERLERRSERLINSPVIRLLSSAQPFCNSDMYSFFNLVISSADSGMDLMQAMQSQMDEATEQSLSEMPAPDSRRQSKNIRRNYIFDLYRFFLLYPYRKQFDNPFASDLPAFTPLEYKSMQVMLADNEAHITTLADLLMHKGQTREALQLYQSLSPQPGCDDHVSLWQKMGYCSQKEGDYAHAFQYYRYAYDLTPDSRWTITHLASVAYSNEDWQAALGYYEMALDIDPDNNKYLHRHISCLMHLQQYAEALPELYKALYLDDSLAAFRYQLVLCLLHTGELKKAASQANLLLASEPDEAHLLLGAIELASHNLADAYTHFNLVWTSMNSSGNIRKFWPAYKEIASHLRSIGVSRTLVIQMYNAVRYITAR